MNIGVNPIGTGINGAWSTGLGASIRTGVISGEELEKTTQQKKTVDYFNNRQQINNDIVTGKITSGNAGQDTIAVRKNNLVNLFAADALEKGANPDKVMAITKKPDEVLKRLTSLGQQQADAVNDYLMNGGYADRVFDYVMGNSKNPYTKKDENASNYIGGLKSVPQQTAGTLLDLANKGLSKIGLTKSSEEQNKKDYEDYHNLVSKLSTDEYNQYKEGKAGNWYDKLFNTGIYAQESGFNEQGQSFVNGGQVSRASMYDAYDDAVKDGFDGSVEDYANYMDNMAAQVTGGISDAIQREIDNTYDTDSGEFKAGKVTGDILEFIATPELKMSKIPTVGKYVTKITEKGLESFPKVTKRINGLGQGLEQGVKMQALEDAYDNELSSAEKYLVTAGINAAVGGVLDGLGSIIKAPAKLIGNPRGAAKTAIGNKTTAEWDEMTKITKESLKNPNSEVTPYTKLAELLKQARKKLIGNRVESGKTLQKTRQKLQFKEGQKYTLKDLETQLNDRLKSLSRYSSQGKGKRAEESVPKISFEGGKLNIDKIENLNLFSRVEGTAGNSKTINLGDKIKNIRDSTIGVGKKPNATTMEQFLRKLKSEVHQSYQGGEDNMIKVLRDGVDKAWNKFNKKLTSDSKTSLKESTAASASDINLANTFDDLIGSLEGDIYSAGAAQGAARTTEATKQLFKAINKATNGKIDMNNEINAWLANIALYGDKNSAMALLDTIYPSVPGMYEFFIKNFIGSMKKAGARRATKDYAQQAAKTYNEGTTVIGNVWDNMRNNAKGWKNIVGGETYIQNE